MEFLYFFNLDGNLITWSSLKQRVVARSSTVAEYRALATAATDLVWIQHLLTEIGVNFHTQQPTILCSDNLELKLWFAILYNMLRLSIWS